MSDNSDQTEKNLQSTILVVDDNPADLQVMGKLLSENGFKSFFANSGKAALESLSHASPDLILLDINMPDMDGFETCRQIKSDKSTNLIPIIFVSSRKETFDKVEGFKAGGVDFITKPFDAVELLARMDAH